ncbi:MAG: isoprenylcysteine carboxylmethyltransferase family protein [Candidatus Doudnabacteria bacterium]|nr:isoprenylcysteine carboxylmethyltransferase family protein [Candidatus Doudnabacteria bacterium]
MDTFTYIVSLSWAAFILFWVISAFGAKRDLGRSPWRRLAWLRIVIVAVILTVIWKKEPLGALAQHWGISQAVPANTALAAIGTVLCLLGVAFAIWARVHLGRNWSAAPALKEDHELITSGPYSLVRHPIYTGIIAAALGTAFVIPVWAALFIVISGIFIWRVRVEESLMTKQFPNQYPDYKKRTWALIPYVW